MPNRARQRALQMAAELPETDRRKSEFLATLAHELRNPLALIRNGLDLANTVEGVPPEAAQLLAMMSCQVRQLLRLVDDLLDLSRISREKLGLRRIRVALTQVVEDAVESCRPMLEEKHHTLTLDTADARTEVEVDAVRTAYPGVDDPLEQRGTLHTAGQPHRAGGLGRRGRGVLAVSDDGAHPVAADRGAARRSADREQSRPGSGQPLRGAQTARSVVRAVLVDDAVVAVATGPARATRNDKP